MSSRSGITCSFHQHNSLEFPVFASYFCDYNVVDYDHQCARYSAATMDVMVTLMRRNEAHNLITRDPIDENAMESRIARIESDVANIQLNMSEVRTDLKAANESIARLGMAVTALEGKVNALEVKVEALDDKVDALDAKVEKLDSRFDKLDAKVDRLETKLGAMLNTLSTDIAKIQATMKTGLWLLGGLGTLATVAKALHWI